jgi:hypothetical protein
LEEQVQYQARQVVQALDLAQVKVEILLQSVALKEARVEVQAELLAQALAQVQLQAQALERVVLRQLEVLPQEQAVSALVQAEAQVEVLEPEQGLVQVQLPEEESAH